MLSGTSMAAPHVSGVAALTVQAHPAWTSDEVRLSIENTGDPTRISGYNPRQAGGGLVQPVASTRTEVVARTDTGDGSSLSFGAVDFTRGLDRPSLLRSRCRNEECDVSRPPSMACR